MSFHTDSCCFRKGIGYCSIVHIEKRHVSRECVFKLFTDLMVLFCKMSKISTYVLNLKQ